MMPQVQLGNGEMIFVGPRQNTVTVGGLAENPKVFEFPIGTPTNAADVMLMARPLAAATHMRIARNTGSVKNVEYYPPSDAPRLAVANGAEIDFTPDKRLGTITVRIEGEHDSQQKYVLPYGSRAGDLLRQVKFSERSNADDIQLIRRRVKHRQKEILQTSLSLQMATLTARSGTNDESMLRRNEADLMLRWIDRARQIEPIGQVAIGHAPERDALLLENGDVLQVPTKDGLVLVSGEVLFPNAIAYSSSASASDYVQTAGGFAHKSGSRRIVVAHGDGSFDQVAENARPLKTGNQVIVLPRVDVKSYQIVKDMTQILYQIAVSVKEVLGL
ncbi:hypothetical protein OLX02_13465 [Novosphingobium sp. KCTC 2891]|uniref:hypothetical protein n=1 Tax=Novosphingobium sp. KCTC 2891 TaxID=2989730 RepID=UPI002223B3C4|nr:hypothetical protein [Novosphingobium sp. KCTC 2891]MCW1383829.1 hypothetical protein [Novosphingobium sp. KCTC 2891]